MFQRGATAAKAWCKLNPECKATIIGTPRMKCCNNWPLNKQRAAVAEMIKVLHALPDDTRVELVSVCPDALSTNLGSFAWLFETYHLLKMWIVIIVPAVFQASSEVFPQATNGIGYGVFELAKILSTIRAIRSRTGEGNKHCRILL